MVQRLRRAAGPAHDDQVGQVGDVVGVHVREEDRVHRAERDAAGHQAARGAPAAVDEDVRFGADDELAGAAAIRRRQGAAGAEQEDLERAHGDVLTNRVSAASWMKPSGVSERQNAIACASSASTSGGDRGGRLAPRAMRQRRARAQCQGHGAGLRCRRRCGRCRARQPSQPAMTVPTSAPPSSATSSASGSRA